MGSCQNYGPFLGTLNNRCRTIIGTQKGAIMLTTTHMVPLKGALKGFSRLFTIWALEYHTLILFFLKEPL